MPTNQKLQSLRAIASVLVRRYTLYPAIILTVLAAISSSLALALSISHSLWWLLLAFIMLLWLFFFMTITIATFAISSRLQPRKLSKKERKQIGNFVDTFTVKYAAVKGAKKSPFLLAFIVAWRARKGNLKKSAQQTITEPIDDIKEVRSEFQKISRLF